MQVKITVSQPGGKTGNSFSQSYSMKDASTIEEVQEAIKTQFGKLFPAYQTLDKPQGKEAKKKGQT
jgi:hypothetical protein